MAEKQEDQPTKASVSAEDEELNELLADALNDFGKPPPEKAVSQKPKELVPDLKPGEIDFSADTTFANFEKDMLKVFAANFQEDMQEVLSQGSPSGIDPAMAEELSENFRKMAEATAKVWSDQGLDGEFTATISETLKNLSEGAENLQNIFPDENLLKMLGPMGLQGEGSDEMLPFIQNMMQSLLSKEILYPALKDLLDKYDGWLNENSNKLEESEVTRYRKQQVLITQVCSILESETESDSSEVKKKRFDTLLNLMQQVQDCGQPPKELMDSIKTFEEFSPAQTDPSQCSVM